MAEQTDAPISAEPATPESGIEPSSLTNWKAEKQGKSWRGTFEFPLYSDAILTGEIADGCGPYRVVNTIRAEGSVASPPLLLRVAVHMDATRPQIGSETDVSAFTGADLADEIACLLSLALGARFAAGSYTRHFEPGGDPLGRPMTDWSPRAIALPGVRRQFVVPEARGEKMLRPQPLDAYASVSGPDAVALVRAARAYRDALWLVESEPALAWLLFVSALEVGAIHVAGDAGDEVGRLRDAAPKLCAALDGVSTDAVSTAAPFLADLFKSTSRFLRFCVDAHPPKRPAKRPREGLRFPWSRSKVKRALSTVYDWRSQSLHAGIPFPPPMCMPPVALGQGEYCETVPGLAASSHGATWTREDMPFGLHLFEHIVRTTLTSWWLSIAGRPSAAHQWDP